MNRKLFRTDFSSFQLNNSGQLAFWDMVSWTVLIYVMTHLKWLTQSDCIEVWIYSLFYSQWYLISHSNISMEVGT